VSCAVRWIAAPASGRAASPVGPSSPNWGEGPRQFVETSVPHVLSVSSTRSGVNGRWRIRLPVSR
jgi:hypothetical protein